ncbi:hypothetical protein QYF61_021997 [Mycteria americana]|uniref:C2 domain-containing protein n=1 Tax=Mycteria americana TaxID=33587 RepID=A0AAN7N7M7_MYCAM|nr:hypothetical protein QYF61_021997 [Mycteria americana]
MSGDYEEDVCRGALRLVQELCFAPRARPPHPKCLEFTDLLRHRGHPRPSDAGFPPSPRFPSPPPVSGPPLPGFGPPPPPPRCGVPPGASRCPPEVSVSLLSVIVTFCGIVLLGVSLFVSWKLCWVPWRHKGGPGAAPRKEPPKWGGGLSGTPCPSEGIRGQNPPPNAATWTWGPVPRGGGGRSGPPRARGPPRCPPRVSMSWGGRDGDGDPAQRPLPAARGQPGQQGGVLPPPHPLPHPPPHPCGRLSVALRYAYGSQQLVVRVLRALDLPPKDANGFSDPYVKIYLLPDRKKKFQTKVRRKTLNPVFEETFSFGVPFAELPARRLHFSVYDFDRFSRHDLIGQVVLDDLLEVAERGGEVPICRDILEGSGEKADLGEVNFSLCYLPTAGRLTVTVIRASNLRAMDLTGFSDPYVKASLMAEGRRLKKRKTSIKKNTLNPSYNEALVFDVPHESVHHVSLTIAVVDYDCIGHNEVIGLCRVGSDAEGPGREHWAQMLANPRKPIEHWHTLVEVSPPRHPWGTRGAPTGPPPSTRGAPTGTPGTRGTPTEHPRHP